ncbi:hypothetical protein J1605_010081 [Eschrichtius robustus]|uniref:Uncharacterized protein n=1 Tax=Eschrichtius robustus TaxID=9764 RepID=A0AB34GQM5_ESCRO|nr:hypothetical protein J1605_010081 [Eschrichtius robustus]
MQRVPDSIPGSWFQQANKETTETRKEARNTDQEVAFRLSRRPGGPLCLSLPTPGGSATSMPGRSRAAALWKAAEDQGRPAPPLTRTGADA